ncbi:Slp family lipoprotein [Acidiferrobacter sp.]|uniref:Slp family lipoprotein n=1 Tax=Acidiferrobacter sp. TaxID=1872107 RepID=UPI0026088F58|nr:Slp family lipoprotein [Acidiferrobacter sp.]
MRSFWVFAGILLLAGCATVPRSLRVAHITPVSVAAARAHSVPLGVRVRWGGIISKVTNSPHATWVQVISRSLRHDGRPRRTRFSGGRFLARVPGFLDPDIYAVGRKITVVGVFSGYEKKPIGNYLYDFPVVRTLAVHLWRIRPHYYTRFYYAYPWPWGWGMGFGPGFGWWGWRAGVRVGP